MGLAADLSACPNTSEARGVRTLRFVCATCLRKLRFWNVRYHAWAMDINFLAGTCYSNDQGPVRRADRHPRIYAFEARAPEPHDRRAFGVGAHDRRSSLARAGSSAPCSSNFAACNSGPTSAETGPHHRSERAGTELARLRARPESGCRQDISVLYYRVPGCSRGQARLAHGDRTCTGTLLGARSRCAKLLILDDWGPKTLARD